MQTLNIARRIIAAVVVAFALAFTSAAIDARKIKCSDVYYQMVNIERNWDIWVSAQYEAGGYGPYVMEFDQPDMWAAKQELWQILMGENGGCDPY